MRNSPYDKLFADYPELFFKNGKPTLIWPIEYLNGWYELIDGLCREITEYLTSKDLNVNVAQIKEKFGGLRFYIDNGDEKVYNIIDRYETQSYKVCEECGEPGSIKHGRSWIFTMCNKCWEEHNEK